MTTSLAYFSDSTAGWEHSLYGLGKGRVTNWANVPLPLDFLT